MDLRIKRTKKAVREAFITLRRKKLIEKITVTELSALAGINKATFYLHYDDIFALSEEIEDMLIDDILEEMGGLNFFLDEPKKYSEWLFHAFMNKRKELLVLFSGSRYSLFSQKVERRIKAALYARYPQFRSRENDIVLTFCIQGTFYTIAQVGDAERADDFALITSLTSDLIERLKAAENNCPAGIS